MEKIIEFLIKKMSWFYMVIIYIYFGLMLLIVAEFGKTALDGFMVSTIGFVIIILQIARWKHWVTHRKK